MPKVKLDSQFALTAYCPPDRKKIDYWDTGQTCSGLVLEVRYPSGGKTWYLRYQDKHGAQRQYRIGKYEDLSFDQVRKTARKLRSEVVLGGDPVQQKAALRAVPTYADLAEQHLAHAKTYQRSYSTTEMYMRRHILPRWGRKRLTDISQQEIAKWLAEKAETKALATVEKIRAIFGRSFELGAQWGVEGAERNPLKGLPRRRFNNARDRYLTADEAERLRKAVATSRNKQLPAIVGMLLLTGARASEVFSAEWKHVDLERRSWLIPMSKTGKARHVPLSEPAIDLIRQIRRKPSARYLFPSRFDPNKHITSIKHGWDRAREDAGLGDVRVHDLRHSAASFMINSGVDLFAVGRVLGHADHKSTMRYSHLANDTLLAAVEAGAKKQGVDWSNTS